MSNTLKLGNGQWATGKDTVLAYNDLNSNYKPLAFSFSRNSSATVVNKDGLIETVGSGEPRIDFKDNTKGALLLEPQRINKLQRSQEFDNSVWGKDGSVTITSNYSISPDGTQNAERFQKTSTVGNEGITQNIFGLSSGTYTLTFYLKSNTNVNQNARLLYGGFQSSEIVITPNWKRFEITYTANTSVDYNGILSNQELDISIWGAQLEQGSYATSYIPTSGQANGVTRVADSSSQTVPDGVIGQTEGTLYAQLGNIPSQAIDDVFVELSDGTSNNRILFYADSNGYIRNQIKASGSISSLINTNVTVSSNMKIAITYKSNEAKVFINGVQYGGTDTSVVVPSVNKMNLENYTGTRSETSTLKDVKLYNTALTNQELIALTTI